MISQKSLISVVEQVGQVLVIVHESSVLVLEHWFHVQHPWILLILSSTCEFAK